MTSLVEMVLDGIKSLDARIPKKLSDLAKFTKGRFILPNKVANWGSVIN